MLPYLEDGLLSWDVCQPDLYIVWAPSNSRSVRITCSTSIHALWRDRESIRVAAGTRLQHNRGKVGARKRAPLVSRSTTDYEFGDSLRGNTR